MEELVERGELPQLTTKQQKLVTEGAGKGSASPRRKEAAAAGGGGGGIASGQGSGAATPVKVTVLATPPLSSPIHPNPFPPLFV